MITDPKPVLAIETSQALCSVCIYFSDENYFSSEINLKNAHAEKIFDLIDMVVKNADISLSMLDSVAVSAGPGSFTGLRIGMSAAKGIAYGAGIKIIPVPTFEALAYQISSFLPENAEFAVANKVNMEEVYFARFKVTANSFIFTEKLRILKKEELENYSSGITVFGNAGARNIVSSPGAYYIAKWSRYSNIQPLAEFDSIEPDYLKHFTIKEKKK